MIKKIKSQLRNIVDLRVDKLKDQQRRNEQTIFSYAQLSNLFKENSFIPFSAWAISPTTILHVLNDILINKRQSVIEFGAGASTFYIAKLIKTLELKISFISVESEEQWAFEINRQLKIYGLESYVTIIIAPLKHVKGALLYKDQNMWYDSEILENNLKNIDLIDLILVDGPFGGSSPYARFSAIPFLKNKISNEFFVVLDDTDRKEELEIIKEWSVLLGVPDHQIDRYSIIQSPGIFDITPFQLVDLP